MHEHCKGCLSYNKDTNKCGGITDSSSNLKGDCPCTNCLIKTMCTEGCDAYDMRNIYRD